MATKNSSGNSSSGNSSGGISDDMRKLLAHQLEIKSWLLEVDKRIHELEGQYLDDTPNGNIVKGWDIETRGPGNLNQGVRKVDNKDRIFSNSSYKFFLEMSNSEEVVEEVPIKIDRRRRDWKT